MSYFPNSVRESLPNEVVEGVEKLVDMVGIEPKTSSMPFNPY